jgi:hypothetical protein
MKLEHKMEWRGPVKSDCAGLLADCLALHVSEDSIGFHFEETIVSGNRATVLCVYPKMRNGQPWHLRGVNVLTDTRIAAKLGYAKGRAEIKSLQRDLSTAFPLLLAIVSVS